nr:transcriptional repressor [Maliibacterium massiliense]
MQQRYSRQRALLLEILRARTDHPTADMLYSAMRAQMPNVSLGTVYRNLAMLTQDGTIQKIVTEKSVDRFDHNPAPHYHFTCLQCGSVQDVDMALHADLDAEAASALGVEITGHATMFYGQCRACARRHGH